jgi:hypothetical protein
MTGGADQGVDDPAASVAAVITSRPSWRDPSRHAWRVDAAFLALGAVLLRIPAFFASRHLTFDDGQYGAVVLGLRDGDLPFRDLFSSQGPLYYPLLGLVDLIGLRTINGARLLTVGAGAVAVVATYAIGRRVSSRHGALLAGGLVATSGSLLYVTAPLSGDGPALALAVVAVALAFRYHARPSTLLAIGIGLTMGSALCVKLIVVPAAIPVGLLLLHRTGHPTWRGTWRGTWRPTWRDRRVRDFLTAVGAAIAVFLAAALPWGIDRVWDQSVLYHQDSKRLRSYGANVTTLLRTLAERDPFVVVAALASLATIAAVAWHRRRSTEPAPPHADGGATGLDGPVRPTALPGGQVGIRLAGTVLGSWLGVQVLFLVLEPAMWRPHVSQVIVPLSLLAVLRPAPWRVLAVLFIVLVPWWVLNTRDVLWPHAYSRAETTAVDRLRALPADAWVISDDPGFAWRAERRVPGEFVDVSMKRFQQQQITTGVVGRAAADPRVCALLVWSKDRLGSLTALPDRLADEGYEVVERFPGDEARVLYARSDCSP